MKVGQDVCLDDILDKFMGQWGQKLGHFKS